MNLILLYRGLRKIDVQTNELIKLIRVVYEVIRIKTTVFHFDKRI